MSVVAKEKSTKWSEAFKLVSKARLGAANPLINEMQERAINAFSEVGLPDKKVEDYKYTNIKLYLNDEFVPANEPNRIKAADIKHLLIKGHAHSVLVNGWFVPELSQLENQSVFLLPGLFCPVHLTHRTNALFERLVHHRRAGHFVCPALD